jgi:REP element-mobilizing transposase RayT
MGRRKPPLSFGFMRKRRGRKRGRKPRPNGPWHSHLRRAPLNRRFPLHVAVRMTDATWNLRSARCFKVLRRAFFGARERFGMRLCEFSVMGNHVHFLVEADDSAALARGMKGLGVRMAKALNRVMGRHGAVYRDRYFARALRTPSEVCRARDYVLRNALKHGLLKRAPDPFSSEVVSNVVAPPCTWLLSLGWRRARHRPQVAAAATAATHTEFE